MNFNQQQQRLRACVNETEPRAHLPNILWMLVEQVLPSYRQKDMEFPCFGVTKPRMQETNIQRKGWRPTSEVDQKAMKMPGCPRFFLRTPGTS